MKKVFINAMLLLFLMVFLVGCSSGTEKPNTGIKEGESDLFISIENSESEKNTVPLEETTSHNSLDNTLSQESIPIEDGVYTFPEESLKAEEVDIIVSNYHVIPDKTVFKIICGAWNISPTVKIAFRKDNQDFCEYMTEDGWIADYTFNTHELPEGDYDIVIYNMGELPIWGTGVIRYELYDNE